MKDRNKKDQKLVSSRQPKRNEIIYKAKQGFTSVKHIIFQSTKQVFSQNPLF